jgi:hypothetical protein
LCFLICNCASPAACAHLEQPASELWSCLPIPNEWQVRYRGRAASTMSGATSPPTNHPSSLSPTSTSRFSVLCHTSKVSCLAISIMVSQGGMARDTTSTYTLHLYADSTHIHDPTPLDTPYLHPTYKLHHRLTHHLPMPCNARSINTC